MTRAGVWCAVILGLVSIVGGVLGYVRAGSGASLGAGVGSGVLLLIFSGFGWRRALWARIAVTVIALALLGRFVPSYFQEPVIWPKLVLILMSSLTLAFSILGMILDRFPGPHSPKSKSAGG